MNTYLIEYVDMKGATHTVVVYARTNDEAVHVFDLKYPYWDRIKRMSRGVWTVDEVIVGGDE